MIPALPRAILTLLAATAAVLPGHAQNWPRFRGPDGQGLCRGQQLADELTSEDIAWSASLPGRGHSSPVVWGKRLFVTAFDSDAQACSLVCLDATDGSERWVRVLEARRYGMHRLNSYASASPVVDGEVVALAWNSGDELRAAAFDLAGEPLWEKTLGTSGAEHGGGASPVLFDSVLLVGNDTENADSFLAGLDAKTGEERWRRERQTSRASFATPLVWRPEGGAPEALFASTSHGITSLDPLTGELRWERPGLFRPRCVASPVLADGLLFTTAGSGGGGKIGVALDLARRGKEGAPAERYRLKRGLPYVPSGVASDGRLFLWADGGVVSCLDLATGEEIWRERAEGTYYGSPILVDGKLLAMNTAGELVVVRAGDTFEELCRLELGEASHATPAMAGGQLFLRTESQVVAIRSDA